MACAERRTSAAGKPSAETLGMRERVTRVSLKSSKCWSAYLSAVLTSPFDSAIRGSFSESRAASGPSTGSLDHLYARREPRVTRARLDRREDRAGAARAASRPAWWPALGWKGSTSSLRRGPPAAPPPPGAGGAPPPPGPPPPAGGGASFPAGKRPPEQ